MCRAGSGSWKATRLGPAAEAGDGVLLAASWLGETGLDEEATGPVGLRNFVFIFDNDILDLMEAIKPSFPIPELLATLFSIASAELVAIDLIVMVSGSHTYFTTAGTGEEAIGVEVIRGDGSSPIFCDLSRRQ